MKIYVTRSLIQICLLGAILFPAVLQAQFTFTTNTDNSLNLASFTGSDKQVVIPDMTNGLPVTSIGNYAFWLNTDLTAVTIGTNVTSIGADAFDHCTHLTSVTIPDNVTSIGGGAFIYCTSLGGVVIPNSVTNIGNGAFSSCASLTNAIIPNRVGIVSSATFSYCYSLAGITIPDSVTNVQNGAFYACTNLANVTIPKSVVGIEQGAFAYCHSLKGVYFQGNAPSPDYSVFSDDVDVTVFYLPDTTGWGMSFDGRPTVLWNPQAQTGDSSFGVQNNQFGFNITGSSNLVVVVEAATNMASSNWISVGTNTLNAFVGTNGTSYFSDPQWTNNPGRFYRFRSP
jgi:BspA type Leucine rich repeat region (6 copies)